MNWDTAGNAYGLKEAFHLLAILFRAASSGAIPSCLAPFLPGQELAVFLDANAAEAAPHL
jgi:hypothetical protein